MADRDVRVVASGGPPPRGTAGWRPAALAALALILLAIAFLIGRASARGGSTSSGPNAGPGGAMPGPARVVNGVPVGYAHSPQGAVAAATNYGVALAGPLFLDDARREAAIRQIGTSSYVKRTLPAAAAAARQLKATPVGQGLRQGAGTLYQGAPLAYRVVSYTPDVARVEIWSLALLGNDAGVDPQATFGTTTTTLRWEGDWKFDTASTQSGPTPGLARGQTPTPGSAFLPRTRPLKEFRYAP